LRPLDANQNILRFGRLLETEIDAAKRVNLLHLLLKEVDNVGRYSIVHLIEIERQIVRNEKFIANQRALVGRLNGNGNSAKIAETLLQTMCETQALCKAYRERIARELMT
jgi:hypothetical protein